MAIVQAYLCEDTGQLFLEKKDYDKHRRSFLAEQKRVAIYEKKKSDFKLEITNFRNSIKSFEELETYLNDNYMNLINKMINTPGVDLGFHSDINALKRCINEYKLDPTNEKFKVTIAFNQTAFEYLQKPAARWSGMDLYEQSNSHRCPIGRKTNWGGREKDVPRSYPGMRTRIGSSRPVVIRENAVLIDCFTNVLNNLNINTGTGGSSGVELEMFSSDWPFIFELQLKHALADRNTHLLSDEFKKLIDQNYPDLDIRSISETIKLQDYNFEDALVFVEYVLNQETSKRIQFTETLNAYEIKGKPTDLIETFEQLSIKPLNIPELGADL